jgi:flagellar hook-length control protein FliK
MLAAASSNNWKMQIDLKPAHLGHISVEMSMQQGQLEAVFDAGQASARQLISEGLDRLRQDLQRAGMNVAHLGLNFGSGAGTGGKPTPRGREGQSDQGAAGSVQGVSAGVPGSRSRAGSDGLDVMV